VFVHFFFFFFFFFFLSSSLSLHQVEIEPGQDANAVAAAHGFRNLGGVGSLEGVYRFAPLVSGPHAARAVGARAVALRADPAVVMAERQEKKQQHTRSNAPSSEM
jgi:hypothetical protein